MIDQRRLAMLARIAGLRKEIDLMALSAASALQQAAEARLKALDTAASEARWVAEGQTDASFLSAQDGFARWTASRRSRLMQDLDAANALWTAERTKAARSFGRCQALDAVQGQVAGQRARRRTLD